MRHNCARTAMSDLNGKVMGSLRRSGPSCSELCFPTRITHYTTTTTSSRARPSHYIKSPSLPRVCSRLRDLVAYGIADDRRRRRDVELAHRRCAVSFDRFDAEI